MTLKLKVHEPAPAIVPPESDTLCEPAAAAIVPVPQVPVRPLGVAMINPLGKESVKATPANARDEFGLDMVKLREVDPPSPMEAAPKDSAIIGGVATIKFADAVFPVPPLVEVTLPVVLM